MRIENKRGNYAFLKGIAPYSAGGAALSGFEVEHARFLRPVPLAAGFEAVDAHLRKAGRPRQALCGMELRSPKPFTWQGFSDFNAGYVKVLKSWDIFVEGVNPVARTNVALEVGSPAEPSLYGFSYTVPASAAGPTFVIAGAGELPEGSLDPHDVIRRGETTPQALIEKARFVMGLMDGRLRGLDVAWDQVTTTGVYTVHDIHPFLAGELLRRMGPAAQHAVTWHYSRPPIVSIEFEMDLRGCRQDVVIQG
jgi:hypothetical protein